MLNVEHILSGDTWQMCAAEQTLRQEIDVHFIYGAKANRPKLKSCMLNYLV